MKQATAITTVEDQQRLLEAEKLKSERKKLRLARRIDETKHRLSGILWDALKKTELRRHAFKTDEELAALKLSEAQKALVRQWQEPKRNAAYALESASRQIESHLRSQGEKQTVQINVQNTQNTIVLPEKQDETIPPVYMDVQVDE